MLKHLIAATAALCLAAPIAAQAQEIPSYAQVASSDQQIHGRITAFDGAYALAVSNDSGYVDNVELHDGTSINPTGLTLAPGMVVSILGQNDGSYFAADEVDTPYNVENAVPFYAGHPWNYYGSSINLSFFFGNSGWWQRGIDHGGYAYSSRASRGNYRSQPAPVQPIERSAPAYERPAPAFERGAPAFQRSAQPEARVPQAGSTITAQPRFAAPRNVAPLEQPRVAPVMLHSAPAPRSFAAPATRSYAAPVAQTAAPGRNHR